LDLRKAVLIVIIFLSGCALSWAADDGFSSAKKIEGKQIAVYYFPDIKVSGLIQKLGVRPSDKILAGMPLEEKASDDNELAASLDSLLMEVSGILDMRPYGLKTAIKICRNTEDLRNIYRSMFAQELGNQKSFYVYYTGTIYVSEESFKREIVGHEMAHAIISHYFVVPAPVKIQEVLSMYVEYNLRRAEK
jgi:hypothetical protein